MSKDSTRFLELDGLRGISILLVLIGHTVPKSFGLPSVLHPLIDAALGVRIFFVLSGFIITSILIQEKKNSGSIDWEAFFLRRLTKLFPSLLIFIISIQFLTQTTSSECSNRSFWVSALYLTEIFGVDCWSLGHTWSLSIEELFYLTWLPCVMYLSRSTLFKILILFTLLSPVMRVLQHLHYLQFPVLSHADSLSWGCLAALIFDSEWFNKIKKILDPASNLLTGFALLVLYLSSFPIHEISWLKWLSYLAVPFRATLQGLIVTFFILSFQRNGHGLLQKTMRSRALTGLGLASYSIYLWQQIIIPNPFINTWAQRADFLASSVCFCGAVLFGLLAYQLFEKPMMSHLRKLLGLSKENLDFGCRTRIRT